MAVNVLGFTIGRQEKEDKNDFILPSPDDGQITAAGSGSFGTYVDLENQGRSELENIQKYREISLFPECDAAIDDIVNEAIVSDEDARSVSLILDDADLSPAIKKKIREEYANILRLLDFNKKGHDLFRRWYVDGRLYFHKVVDEQNPKQGIKKLRMIDPRSVKYVREIERETNEKTQVEYIKSMEEYFLYSENSVIFNPVTGKSATNVVKLSKDSVAYVPSGITDLNTNKVIGYLHKAIKPVNQLRMMEDAVVIYRIARAPERRVFYVDVGNLPKQKAEQYLKGIMNNFRNKLVYNGDTGEIQDDKKHMSMLEDFWMPRREGGRGTEISTLGGGQNLGEIEDIEYFKRKLFLALNVPQSRMQPDSGFQLGRATEINRDEVKFNKFVGRLRKRFNELFQDLLRTQLILKGIITEDDWVILKEQLRYDYLRDNQFAELKNAEVIRERLSLLRDMDEYVGKYYSVEWVRKNILRQTDSDIEYIDKQIEDEKDQYGEPEDDEGGF
jgi:hypothetical protein